MAALEANEADVIIQSFCLQESLHRRQCTDLAPALLASARALSQSVKLRRLAGKRRYK